MCASYGTVEFVLVVERLEEDCDACGYSARILGLDGQSEKCVPSGTICSTSSPRSVRVMIFVAAVGDALTVGAGSAFQNSDSQAVVGTRAELSRWSAG